MTPRRAALLLLVTLVVSVGAYHLVARSALSYDLTEEGSATLSDTTHRVLREVDGRVEITAFFGRDDPGRVEAATLLARYRDANRRITYRLLDPTLAPAEARRLGVESSGSAAVQDIGDRDRVEVAQYTIEIDITSAIARLVRNVDATVCFTTGHGERARRNDDPSGLSEAAQLLRSNGYRIRDVDLLTGSRVRSCEAVVVAAPSTELDDRTQRVLRDYLEGDGKAWFLADPEHAVDMNRIVRGQGIRFVRGVIFEADEDSHLPNDVSAPIVRRYSGGSPVVRGLGPTFYPGAQGVERVDSDNAGLTVTELAATSRLAYLDRKDIGDFDPDDDREGPVAIGIAADRSSVAAPGTDRARVRRTRVLAWGDVDFVSNAFIGDGSNGRLFVQGIDWLTQPEDLVTAVPAFPKLRELELTQARSRYVLFLMAGVIPALFLLAGAFVWVLRRGR